MWWRHLAHLRRHSAALRCERTVQRYGSDAVHVAHGIAVQMPIGLHFAVQLSADWRWQQQFCSDNRLLESRTGRQSDAGHRRQHSAHDTPGRSRPRWKQTHVNSRRFAAVRDARPNFSRPEFDRICRIYRPVAQRKRPADWFVFQSNQRHRRRQSPRYKFLFSSYFNCHFRISGVVCAVFLHRNWTLNLFIWSWTGVNDLRWERENVNKEKKSGMRKKGNGGRKWRMVGGSKGNEDTSQLLFLLLFTTKINRTRSTASGTIRDRLTVRSSPRRVHPGPAAVSVDLRKIENDPLFVDWIKIMFYSAINSNQMVKRSIEFVLKTNKKGEKTSKKKRKVNKPTARWRVNCA